MIRLYYYLLCCYYHSWYSLHHHYPLTLIASQRPKSLQHGQFWFLIERRHLLLVLHQQGRKRANGQPKWGAQNPRKPQWHLSPHIHRIFSRLQGETRHIRKSCKFYLWWWPTNLFQYSEGRPQRSSIFWVQSRQTSHSCTTLKAWTLKLIFNITVVILLLI